MIVTKKDFCLYIEELNASNKQSMIDNVLDACEEYNIDPSMIEPLINRSIKEKLELEFIGTRLVVNQQKKEVEL